MARNGGVRKNVSAEWVGAISSAGTFVVIAASAIAALLQLRHMRSGNQIAAYNECRETMDSAPFRDALQFIRTKLPERLTDAAACEEIVRAGLAGEYGDIRLVANLFESMGLFVRTGMMEQRIACELWSGIVLSTWNALRPLTAVIRTQISEGVWTNFEYMAVLAKHYIDEYPHGYYPAGVERLPLDKPA
jgi:hypothetical protein